MIPYDDIPEQLLITHPRHKDARQQRGGREPQHARWQPAWTPFAVLEHETGRTAAEIAHELGVTAEAVRYHLREALLE